MASKLAMWAKSPEGKDAKKASLDNIKGLVKAYDAAAAKTKSPDATSKDHDAATKAAGDVENASRKHENTFRSRAMEEQKLAYASKARWHANDRVTAEKSEQEKRNAEATAHNALPSSRAAVHLRDVTIYEEGAHKFKMGMRGRTWQENRAAEHDQARQAVGLLEKAKQLDPTRAPEADKRIARMKEHHAGAFEDQHPRDDAGKLVEK